MEGCISTGSPSLSTLWKPMQVLWDVCAKGGFTPCSKGNWCHFGCQHLLTWKERKPDELVEERIADDDVQWQETLRGCVAGISTTHRVVIVSAAHLEIFASSTMKYDKGLPYRMSVKQKKKLIYMTAATTSICFWLSWIFQPLSRSKVPVIGPTVVHAQNNMVVTTGDIHRFKQKIFTKYIMLDHVNDEEQHAYLLGKMLQTFEVVLVAVSDIVRLHL
ncbi:hypothetical protein Tco_0508188 [Tanacetum coccineum]